MQKLAAVQSEDFNRPKGIPGIAPASRSRARRPLELDHPGRASEGSAPFPGDAELHNARQGRSQRHAAAWRDPSRRTAGYRKDLSRPRAGTSHRRDPSRAAGSSPRGRAARADQLGDGQNAAGGVGVVFAVDRGVSRGWPDYRSSLRNFKVARGASERRGVRETKPLTTFRFLHAADLHLDSPLVGLSCKSPDFAKRVETASRQAFDNLVALAIEERCRFVVLAGDVFDRDLRNFQTGLYFLTGMKRLADAGIDVFLVLGNHDAGNRFADKLAFTNNVHLFSKTRAEIEDARGRRGRCAWPQLSPLGS